MGKYSDSIVSRHTGMSPAEIRAQKVSTWRSRSKDRRKFRHRDALDRAANPRKDPSCYGLREQIVHASNRTQVEALLLKGRSFANAGPATRRKWLRTAERVTQKLVPVPQSS